MTREAHLIVTPPEQKPFAHVLDKKEIAAGRDLGADLTIEDSLLSRVHLRFVLDGDRWCVEDQGSRNGTFVNGKRIGKGERVPLQDGMEVSAGLSKLKFVVGERDAAAPPLRRVARPTEDFFSISDLMADKSVDVPAELTRLMIKVSEDLVPERSPDRVLAAACSIAQGVLAAKSVTVQRASDAGACEILASVGDATKPLDSEVVRPLIEHRGARMLHDEKLRRLVVAIDAPRQSVLVADVGKDSDERKLKIVIAVASLMSGIYESAESHKELRKDNQRLLDQVRVGFAYDVDNPACLAGRSGAAQRLREAIEKAAKSSGPLAIVGEAGVGKELLARAVHARSARAADPFIAVDGTKPDQIARYKGVQAVLFVEHAEAARDVLQKLSGPRVIAASLDAPAVSGDVIEVPPLRTRGEDIMLIAERLLDELNRHHKLSCTFATDAIQWITARPWRENVRELSSTIERALFVADGGQITAEDLEQRSASGETPTLPDAIAAFEKDYVLRVLQSQHGHRIRTAGILGISRQALGRKLRAYGLIGDDADD